MLEIQSIILDMFLQFTADNCPEICEIICFDLYSLQILSQILLLIGESLDSVIANTKISEGMVDIQVKILSLFGQIMQEKDPKFKKEILEKSSIYVFLQTFVQLKAQVSDQISISVFNVIKQSIIVRDNEDPTL